MPKYPMLEHGIETVKSTDDAFTSLFRVSVNITSIYSVRSQFCCSIKQWQGPYPRLRDLSALSANKHGNNVKYVQGIVFPKKRMLLVYVLDSDVRALRFKGCEEVGDGG